MRIVLPVLGILFVAACAPTVPDSGSGVGFGDSVGYAGRRDAELTGNVAVLPPAETGDVAAASAAPVVLDNNNSDISDEQDFKAVSARESIESDAERLQAQREEYKVIAPTALPTRRGSSPNIVEYALSTTNQIGSQQYTRSNPLRNSVSPRNCAKYTSGDLAQLAFLKAGGPKRDRLNLDPDGDGFACAWDPSPFRVAVNR